LKSKGRSVTSDLERTNVFIVQTLIRCELSTAPTDSFDIDIIITGTDTAFSSFAFSIFLLFFIHVSFAAFSFSTFASSAHCDIVDFLARNKRADLSITRHNRHNVHSIVGQAPNTTKEKRDKTYNVLKANGVTSEYIAKGFRSSLSSIDDSLLFKRLAQTEGNHFYIRAMSLSLVELAEEAKERSVENSEFPLSQAARMDGLEVVVERIQRAFPGSVNAMSNDSSTALITAAYGGNAGHTRTLATMGTDLSLKGNGGPNAFEAAEFSDQPPAKKAAVFKVLSEHSVTSRNIPPGFQSPL
jgi:hypothetical protein